MRPALRVHALCEDAHIGMLVAAATGLAAATTVPCIAVGPAAAAGRLCILSPVWNLPISFVLRDEKRAFFTPKLPECCEVRFRVYRDVRNRCEGAIVLEGL